MCVFARLCCFALLRTNHEQFNATLENEEFEPGQFRRFEEAMRWHQHTSYIHHTYIIHTSYIHHTYIIHTDTSYINIRHPMTYKSFDMSTHPIFPQKSSWPRRRKIPAKSVREALGAQLVRLPRGRFVGWFVGWFNDPKLANHMTLS